MTGLSIDNITAGYDGREIISGIEFSIERGEFCALLGRNGSGKTTLFKSLCGLIKSYSGSFYVDDVDCTNLNERKRAQYISYIPQRHSKLQGVLVRDVVLMGYNPTLPLLASPNKSEMAYAENLVMQMELGELADKDFSRLSEGQKQLIILTRTLVQNAPVMLMDEPDSSLDFPNRHSVLAKIRDIIHQQNKVGLVTLHDPNFALEYCDKIVLIANGKLLGELRPKTATEQEVLTHLSKIYGNIDVLEHRGRFVVQMNC